MKILTQHDAIDINISFQTDDTFFFCSFFCSPFLFFLPFPPKNVKMGSHSQGSSFIGSDLRSWTEGQAHSINHRHHYEVTAESADRILISFCGE